MKMTDEPRPTSRRLNIPASHGHLEAILREASAPFAAVVVCHPHPLGGGTMDNNVVYRVAKVLGGAAETSDRRRRGDPPVPPAPRRPGTGRRRGDRVSARAGLKKNQPAYSSEVYPRSIVLDVQGTLAYSLGMSTAAARKPRAPEG